MSERITININREVEVTLTESGRQIYRDYFLKIGMEPPLKCESSDPIKFQLWDVMSIFGSRIVFGKAFNPFVDNDIMLLPDQLAISMAMVESRLKELSNG